MAKYPDLVLWWCSQLRGVSLEVAHRPIGWASQQLAVTLAARKISNDDGGSRGHDTFGCLPCAGGRSRCGGLAHYVQEPISPSRGNPALKRQRFCCLGLLVVILVFCSCVCSLSTECLHPLLPPFHIARRP